MSREEAQRGLLEALVDPTAVKVERNRVSAVQSGSL